MKHTDRIKKPGHSVHPPPSLFRRIRSGLAFLGLLVVLALGVSACGTSVEDAVAGNETPITTVSDDEITDADITQAVERELLLARGITPTTISVATEDGIVTLSGEVTNLLARERADRITQSVKGVLSVVNTVDVVPVERSDAEIKEDVAMAFVTDPATDGWEITSDVNEGVVTLTGTVDSWQERTLAERVARGVRGVTGIHNEIIVEFDAARSDTDIRYDIEQALMWDTRINDALIEVRVDDGMVELEGAVGSAYERSLALSRARVNGVRDVDASGLNVQWWARDDMKRADWAVERSDAEIRDAVTRALVQDPRVASYEVFADVDDGVVTLSGTVDNLKSRTAAAQTAGNTVGVWSVQNHIVVSADERRADSVILGDVETKLLRDPYVEAFEIGVAVDDGVVTLSGEVDSYFEKRQAEDKAATVAGVQRVENNLDIGYDLYDYGAWFYDWDPVTVDVDYVFDPERTMSDTEIRTEIEEELWWSPYVDFSDVTVSVENGHAVLSGTVDTWQERRAASEEALEGGALTLDNDLLVRFGPEPTSAES